MPVSFTRRRTVPVGIAAAVVASQLALVGVAGTAHAAPPLSEPYSPEVLDATYPSDAPYSFIPMLDAFSTLRTDHPDVMARNLELTVEINHAATAEEAADAVVDQYADMSRSMSDGLGEHVGQLYSTALAEGRLPKIAALIPKDGGLFPGPSASTTPPKEFFDYPRPYVVAPDRIVHYDKEGGTAYDTTSGSYPSGHTSQAYWQGTALATLLPELAPQILARTSQAAHHRVVMGVHYPLDVIGGRMMGQAIAARRWADPEFRPVLAAARQELVTVLSADCGMPLDACIARDDAYLPTEDAVDLYTERMTYGFAPIAATGQDVVVPEGAEDLLLPTHPDLTADQRREVLELTAIDSGFPLDKPEASWQRLNLAAAMAATVGLDRDGDVVLTGPEGVAAVRADLESFVAAGEVSGPIVPQLRATLRVAEHHLDRDRIRPAVVTLRLAVARLDRPVRSDRLTDDARTQLREGVQDLVDALV